MRKPISGAPCDTSHPFPAPEEGEWIDSMDYGATNRRPGSVSMWDVDTTPTWRLIAASLWHAPCIDQHLAEVATDAYLTTHLIAVTVRVGLPRNETIYALALREVGAAEPINAMREGLAAARKSVEVMDLDSRKRIVNECLAIVLHSLTELTLDIPSESIKNVSISREG